jgi:hypothetical protein
VSQKSQKSIAQLKKDADKYFSKYIRYRDSQLVEGVYIGDCITCGVRKPAKEMQNGHFVSRRVNLLRYDEQNCNMQCSGCNVFNHGQLYEYSLALDDKYGDGTAARLHSLRFKTHKLTIAELEEIISYSKEQIKFYEDRL